MNTLVVNFLKISILASACTLAACGGSSDSGYGDSSSSPSPTPTPVADPSPTPEPVAVSLAEVQAQVFDISCNSSGCHDASSSQGQLNLASETASFNELVNVPATRDSSILLVEPGNPDDSYLVRSLEATGGAVVMPLGAPALSSDLITLVRDWISTGALQSSSVASASRVVKTRVEDNFHSVTFELDVSANLDEASFAQGAIQLFTSNGDDRHLVEPEDVDVDIFGSALVVTYYGTTFGFNSLELVLNRPESASLLDEFGAIVDEHTFTYHIYQ